jgi:chromosome segregation ATPase
MKFNSDQINRKDDLEAKIRNLELTKSHLQHDIAKIQESIATAGLEKKAKNLEGEINSLRTVKIRLEKKMKTSNLQQGKTNSSISKDANVQKKSQKQQSPVRYGTWSRLPIS